MEGMAHHPDGETITSEDGFWHLRPPQGVALISVETTSRVDCILKGEKPADLPVRSTYTAICPSSISATLTDKLTELTTIKQKAKRFLRWRKRRG
jgi:hypothetical protein